MLSLLRGWSSPCTARSIPARGPTPWIRGHHCYNVEPGRSSREQGLCAGHTRHRKKPKLQARTPRRPRLQVIPTTVDFTIQHLAMHDRSYDGYRAILLGHGKGYRARGDHKVFFSDRRLSPAMVTSGPGPPAQLTAGLAGSCNHCLAGTRLPARRQLQPGLRTARTHEPRITLSSKQPPSQAPLSSALLPIFSSRPARPLRPAVTTLFECPDAKSCQSLLSLLCCRIFTAMLFLCSYVSSSTTPWLFMPYWKRLQREALFEESQQHPAFSGGGCQLFSRVPPALVPVSSLPSTLFGSLPSRISTWPFVAYLGSNYWTCQLLRLPCRSSASSRCPRFGFSCLDHACLLCSVCSCSVSDVFTMQYVLHSTPMAVCANPRRTCMAASQCSPCTHRLNKQVLSCHRDYVSCGCSFVGYCSGHCGSDFMCGLGL